MQSMASTGKHSQTPKFPFTKNFDTVSQQNLAKNRDKSPSGIKFRYQKRLETQKSSLANFFGTVCRKFLMRYRDDQFRIVFWYQKLSETTKRTPHQLLLAEKNFRNLFVMSFATVHQSFGTEEEGSTRNFEKHLKIQGVPKVHPFYFFQYCHTEKKKILTFWMIP